MNKNGKGDTFKICGKDDILSSEEINGITKEDAIVYAKQEKRSKYSGRVEFLWFWERRLMKNNRCCSIIPIIECICRYRSLL